MQENRIIELLARKMATEASVEELEELEELLLKYPDSLYYIEVLAQLGSGRNSKENVELLYNKHKEKYKKDFTGTASTNGFIRFKAPQYAFSVICFLLVITAIGYLVKNKKYLPEKSTEIIAGKGIRKKITLPDGTFVWLNSGSKLVFDNKMKKKAYRSVNLTGEAFFDVAKDKNHPFIIRTENISIKVLGTAFNVKEYAGEEKTEAVLLRGIIELVVNERPQQKIILKPNEKFALIVRKKTPYSKNNPPPEKKITILLENTSPVKVANKEYLKEISWVENELVFKNETFEELVPQLERWFNVNIHIDRESIGNYRFTGVFKDENIIQALTAMNLIKPFNFKIKENDIKIY